MIDIKKQRQKELAKEKTRRRMNVQIDPDNYEGKLQNYHISALKGW